MENITVSQALSAGFRTFIRRPILLACIGLAIAAVALLGQQLPMPLQPPLGTLALSLILVWPLQTGMDYVALRVLRRDAPRFRDLSIVARHWPGLVLTSGIRYGLASISSIFIAAGTDPLGLSPFLAFPLSLVGLIVGLIFAFAPILLLDRQNALTSQGKLNAWTALRLSAQRTRGRKGTLFLIGLVASIPLLMVGFITVLYASLSIDPFNVTAVTLVVSLIAGAFLSPWIAASIMAVYDHLVEESRSDAGGRESNAESDRAEASPSEALEPE